MLLARGANANATNNDGWVTLHQRFGTGSTPLHYAAAGGHAKVVNLLLSEDVDVNASTAYGDTPLRKAVENKHVEVVQLLLAVGADANKKVIWGPTLLQLAKENKNKRIKQLLLTAGADANAVNKNGDTPAKNEASCRCNIL